MDSNKIDVRRSFIFTPGLKPEMFPKAIDSGADMVCIELEDGIAIKDKDDARKNTIEALKTLEVKSGVELVVRINCQRTKFGLLDLEAFVSSKMNIKSLMLPKVKTPDEITFIDDLLTDCGLDTNLHVIMETNEALESIYDIAHSSKRIVALYFGGVDMAAELRVPNEYKNLIYARSKLVHAGASVGVDVVDVPYLDLENMDGMKKKYEELVEKEKVEENTAKVEFSKEYNQHHPNASDSEIQKEYVKHLNALEKGENLKGFYIRNMVGLTGKDVDEILSDYEKMNTEFREKNNGLLEREIIELFEEECKILLTEMNCRIKFVEEVIKMTGEKKEQEKKKTITAAATTAKVSEPKVEKKSKSGSKSSSSSKTKAAEKASTTKPKQQTANQKQSSAAVQQRLLNPEFSTALSSTGDSDATATTLPLTSDSRGITVKVQENTHVVVWDRDNVELFRRYVGGGKVVSLSGKPPFTLLVSYPEGATVVYGGREFRIPVGKSGRNAKVRVGR